MNTRVRIFAVVATLCLCGPVPAADGSSTPQVTVSGYDYSSAVLETQAKLRKTQAAENPEVRKFMDLIDAGLADANDLESFGNLLTRRGFLELAVVYSREAIRFDPGNAVYWTNLGTILNQMGDSSSAISAYKHAIEIDPGMANAQYSTTSESSTRGRASTTGPWSSTSSLSPSTPRWPTPGSTPRSSTITSSRPRASCSTSAERDARRCRCSGWARSTPRSSRPRSRSRDSAFGPTVSSPRLL
jgi:hypothetical protein